MSALPFGQSVRGEVPQVDREDVRDAGLSRHPQKAYLRALGKKAAGFGQHRPRGQHAAPEFLKESPHLTMVLAGTIQRLRSAPGRFGLSRWGAGGLLIQELRRKVGAIGPCDRFKLRVYRGLAEEGLVFQRLEHGTPELSAQIDGPSGAVIETEPKPIALQGLYLDNSGNHDLLQRFNLV